MEEETLKRKIDEHKQVYKEGFTALRAVKSEVERIQRKLEKQRVKLQKDFETWFDVVKRESQISDTPKRAKEAWQPPKSMKPFPPSNPDQILCKENQRNHLAHQHENWMEQRRASKGDAGADSSQTDGADRPHRSTSVVREDLLTGNKEADDDITAFFRAKEELLQRRRARD